MTSCLSEKYGRTFSGTSLLVLNPRTASKTLAPFQVLKMEIISRDERINGSKHTAWEEAESEIPLALLWPSVR